MLSNGVTTRERRLQLLARLRAVYASLVASGNTRDEYFSPSRLSFLSLPLSPRSLSFFLTLRLFKVCRAEVSRNPRDPFLRSIERFYREENSCSPCELFLCYGRNLNGILGDLLTEQFWRFELSLRVNETLLRALALTFLPRNLAPFVKNAN